ncbi:hypothetical protein SGL43_03482 [Streptomyces globisporus]|uniref:Uncharacterized protein n=1 Tax=Streptomyces globisporus TaxID=1908 RepID=A0ABM9GXZ8_STRGL|nr:hypothetical protein SGL43_03482 [Streptomyces globisporus]
MRMRAGRQWVSRTATMPLKTPAYAVPSGPIVMGAQLLS